ERHPRRAGVMRAPRQSAQAPRNPSMPSADALRPSAPSASRPPASRSTGRRRGRSTEARAGPRRATPVARSRPGDERGAREPAAGEPVRHALHVYPSLTASVRPKREPAHAKAAAILRATLSTRAERIVDTLIGLDPMADLPRTGWLLRGVRPCESIADHSYFVAVTVMLIVDALREEGVTVDGEKALRMALVHDAPEAKTGDVPMPQKTERMDAALEELEEQIIGRLVPEPQQREWREMEDGESLEARIVKVADKIQMMTKALVYGRAGRGDLHEFWMN